MLGNMMTCALTVLGEVFQLTPGSQALMRDLFSCRAWSTEIELTEKVMIEIYQPAAECMSQAQSASAKPSGLQRFLPTLGWRLESVSSPESPSLTPGSKTTEWLSILVAAMMRWP